MSSRRPPSTRACPEAEPTSFDATGRPVLHCAIYTRQSVSRGEQDLTSCDVQRERCEDYVRAMQYEGWVALDERFDDLGVSGGMIDAPRKAFVFELTPTQNGRRVPRRSVPRSAVEALLVSRSGSGDRLEFG